MFSMSQPSSSGSVHPSMAPSEVRACCFGARGTIALPSRFMERAPTFLPTLFVPLNPER